MIRRTTILMPQKRCWVTLKGLETEGWCTALERVGYVDSLLREII